MPRPTLVTADQVTLSGRRWLTDEAPSASVVLIHGFCASSDDAAVVAVAESLHRDGLDVVSYDARGHGRSMGESTLGDLEQHDVAAAVELARQRSDDVVLVGASMGAIAALRYAATDATLRGVVSVSCPARWTLPVNPAAAAAAVMTRTPFGRALLARMVKVRVARRWTNPEPPIELVSRLQVPLTVIHGTNDRFIPVKSSYELYAKATAERSLELVPRMGHAYDQLATDAIRRAVMWSLTNRLVTPAL
jgi:alpha-beta hydrolase superfamily lysophospholipase